MMKNKSLLEKYYSILADLNVIIGYNELTKNELGVLPNFL